MNTRESLIDVLTEIVKDHWKSKNQAVLLSNLPPLFVSNGLAYRDVLGVKSLKSFIEETSNEGASYRLVVHPSQPAKLGVVPVPDGIHYQFPECNDITESVVIDNRFSEKALMDFLKALKKLPSQDIENVDIPISVLVKMMK